MDLIIELREAELDEVYGGQISFAGAAFSIRQNARGGDSIAVGGNGGSADASGAGSTAFGGIGGAAASGAGGFGGGNLILVGSGSEPQT